MRKQHYIVLFLASVTCLTILTKVLNTKTKNSKDRLFHNEQFHSKDDDSSKYKTISHENEVYFDSKIFKKPKIVENRKNNKLETTETVKEDEKLEEEISEDEEPKIKRLSLTIPEYKTPILTRSLSTDQLKKLKGLCIKTYHQTLNRCVIEQPSGFIITGDIADMWLRDSAAQVNNYVLEIATNPQFYQLVKNVAERQAFFILQDPYANSFRKTFNTHPSAWEISMGRKGWIATDNYELDSGAYFMVLVYKIWKISGELLDSKDVKDATKLMIKTWITEQQHELKSKYRYIELSRRGLGSRTNYTGMTWSGYRPSDDACKHHYNIPGNIFASVALGYAKEMLLEWKILDYYDKATRLQADIIEGINRYGKGKHNGKTIYCYEVDGLGNCNKMDDANIPSLLSLPYIDPEMVAYNEQIYKNTKQFIQSADNPTFYEGTFAKGIGSPHTPVGYVWHMSMIMEAYLEKNGAKKIELVKQLIDSTKGTMHESFDPNNPIRFTRSFFAWADTLFSGGSWCEEFIK